MLELIFAALTLAVTVTAGYFSYLAAKMAYLSWADAQNRLKSLDKEKQAARLKDLMKRFESSSAEIDQIIFEIHELAKSSQLRAKEVEKSLAHLTEKEKNAKERIDLLEGIPLEAAEHFADLVERADKKSEKRDYLLFVSASVITIIAGWLVNSFLA